MEEKELEKIVSLRTHENVTLDGKYQNNFSTEKRPNRPTVKMRFRKDLQAVEIRSNIDAVIVPMVNIAFIKLESELSKQKRENIEAEEKKPKSNIKPHEIKKPR